MHWPWIESLYWAQNAEALDQLRTPQPLLQLVTTIEYQPTTGRVVRGGTLAGLNCTCRISQSYPTMACAGDPVAQSCPSSIHCLTRTSLLLCPYSASATASSTKWKSIFNFELPAVAAITTATMHAHKHSHAYIKRGQCTHCYLTAMFYFRSS